MIQAELSTDNAITIVTGLPRSGTSMMMQILLAGGLRVLTDEVRQPDCNNPYGYFEYTPATRLFIDNSWLPKARGCALKIVAPLLTFLPTKVVSDSELPYRVIFMNRDLAAIIDSQYRMLNNLGRHTEAQQSGALINAMQQNLRTAQDWVDKHALEYINLDYDDIINCTSRLSLIPKSCKP